MAKADRALEIYLTGIMQDSKQTPERRDNAAKQLAKHLSTKRRMTTKRKEAQAERGVKPRGKKEQRKATSEKNASSEEWSDLIPKAKVLEMRRAKA